MSGFKNIPGRPVTDPQSGLGADVIVDGDTNRLAVDGTFTGSVTTTPPSDRRFLTLTVTGTEQAVTFASFNIKGINIKASQSNDGAIRLGETGLAASNEYTILEPGEVWNAEVSGTLNPVYVVYDTGTTSAIIHITALGDPA